MAHAPAQTEQRQAAAISPTSPSTSASRRQSYSPAAYAAYYAAQLAPSTSKATADNTVTPAGQGEPNNTQRKADEPTEKESAKRKRIAREEDALLMREAAHRVAQAILADQLAVTYPDYKTPFRDATDVVHRLLPYHIFQQPDEDILSTRTRNLKRKEKEDEEAGALRQDVQDLRSNLALLKRRKALQDRFHSIRTKSAKHEAPSEQLYQVQSLALDDDRRYNALLNTEIRATRDQLAQMEKDAREKKEKEQAEARKAYQAYTAQLAAVAQASAAAHSPTARTPGNPYAGYTAATGAVPISSAEIQRQAQSGDYRAAYMQYAQAWAAYAQAQTQAAQRTGVATVSAAATPGSYAPATSPATSITPLNVPSPSTAAQPPTVATSLVPPTAPSVPTSTKASLPSAHIPAAIDQTAPLATSTSVVGMASLTTATPVRAVPTHPIPLQIPASVLPAFETLGIRPVQATEASSANAPPPAVLVGTRENGQMLDITINLSLLDPAQLSGLAAVLNMVKTSGVSLQAGASGTTAPASSVPTSPATPRALNGVGQSPSAGVTPSPLNAAYYSYYPYYQASPPTAVTSSSVQTASMVQQQPQPTKVPAYGETLALAGHSVTNCESRGRDGDAEQHERSPTSAFLPSQPS